MLRHSFFTILTTVLLPVLTVYGIQPVKPDLAPVSRTEILLPARMTVAEIGQSNHSPTTSSREGVFANLQHVDNQAEYYLGSGDVGDTLAVVFTPDAPARVVAVYVQWFDGGTIKAFAADYSAEAAALSSDGEVSAFDRGTLDVSPIGAHRTAITDNLIEGYVTDWSALLDIGGEFVVGDSNDIHSRESFVIALVKDAESPHPLADATDNRGYRNYTWFGGPWTGDMWGRYGASDLMMRVVVEYPWGGPVTISNLSQLNNTYNTTGPFTVYADLQDDVDGTVAIDGSDNVTLFGTVNGDTLIIADGVPYNVDAAGNGSYSFTFSGSYSPGTQIEYFIRTTDDTGIHSESMHRSFQIKAPQNPTADMLFIADDRQSQMDLYRITADWNGIDYEYWNVQAEGGIDASVINYGWSNIVIYGWGNQTLPVVSGELDPGYADFMDAGGNLVLIDQDWFYGHGLGTDLTFSSGDFAYDYFGLAGGTNDPATGGVGAADTTYLGIGGTPMDTPFQTEPLVLRHHDWNTLNWADYLVAGSGTPVFQGSVDGNHYGVVYDNGVSKGAVFSFLAEAAVVEQEGGSYAFGQFWDFFTGVLEWLDYTPNGMSIHQARFEPLGEVVTVRGTVTTPNFDIPGSRSEYGLQEGLDGIILYSNSFDANLSVGDYVIVTGTLTEYRGKLELVPAGIEDIRVQGTSALPAFQTISIADLVADHNQYESELIRIENASIVDGEWPNSGIDANMQISDPSGATVTMRIDKETDADDNPAPATPFIVHGIVGDFDGPQILPRAYSDFLEPETGTITFQADLTSFIQNGWFDPADPADSIVVNGDFNGWNSTERMTPDIENPNIYTMTIPNTGNPGDQWGWKFRLFPAAKWANNGWEEGDNRMLGIQEGDIVLPPVVPNCIYAETIEQDVLVTFRVDMFNAINYHNNQPFNQLESVWLNGDFVTETGWANWSVDDTTAMVRLYDNGTNGDALSGDDIWTAQVNFPAGSGAYHAYKYAAYDPTHMDTTIYIDNEAGYGDDHTVSIDDTAPTFDAGIDIWKTRLVDITSIAQVRSMADGEVVTISGIVTSPNFSDGTSGITEHTLQDESAGIVVFTTAFDAQLQVGQEIIITGELLTYNGKSEIVPTHAGDIQTISFGNWVEPTPIQAADLAGEQGELLESRLVRMDNVDIIEGAWPVPGSNANLTIFDGSTTTTMRIDKETDIDENPQPEGPFNLLGIISQFDTSEPYDAGYQIMPRFYSDFSQGGIAAPITFQADLTNFIQNGWFDPENPEHQIVVNGDFNGWNAVEPMMPLEENPNIYTYTVSVQGTPGMEVRWKFRMSPSTLWEDSGWEIGANDAFEFTGEALVLPLREPNCVFNAPLSQAVSVTFRVDMNEARSYHTGQPFNNLQSVWMNGGFATESGWAGWAIDDTTDMIRMYDDGTNGDASAGDGIWSSVVIFPEGSGRRQDYKFGAYDPDNMDFESPYAMDNEAGWGMNHHINIDDSDPIYLPPVDVWASGSDFPIPIADARSSEGSIVTVQGIITSPNFGTPGSFTEYTLQDESAGIVLFTNSFDVGLQVGDEVKVTGSIEQYNGKMEIIPADLTDVQIISSDNDLPPFQTLALNVLNTNHDDYESELVEILDVVIVEGGWPEPGNDMNLTISDPSGATMTMRVDKETDVDDNPAPLEPFTLRGVVGDYNGAQILPRFYSDLLQSDPELSHFELVYAGNPYLAMNFYITSALIGEEEVSVGDEIGIFDGEYCVGAGVLTAPIDQYLALVAATDDPGTPEIDGFTPGNAISYRIWDASEGLEITNVSAAYTLGDGTFSSQGTAMAELTGSSSLDMSVVLATGWNIMSFYALPDATNLQTILQPLLDDGSLLKVQDETGAALEELPNLGWVNNIGEMDPAEGYYVKMATDNELVVNGAPVGLPFAIPLNTGWNIMGYPLSEGQNAHTAVQDLINDGVLLKVQNESGAALEELPNLGWVNNIGDLLPGKGYYIKLSGNADLILNAPTGLARTVPVQTTEPGRHFFLETEGNPYLAMNIYVMSAMLDDLPLTANMEIGVFDGDVCVGSARLTESLVQEDAYLPLIVGMDDPLTESVDGFTPGNTVTFRVWTGEKEQPMGATILTGQGSLAFEAQGSLVVDLSGVTIPDNYALYDCYPNPFNPSTTIRYDLPQDTRVALVIYDVLGREVCQLVVGHETAGEKAVVWDGKDGYGRTVPSGIYVYRLQAGEFSQVKKALFVK